MAQKNSAKTTVKRKRSKKQQAMFRRRRIVVGIAALIAIVFVVFCIYSVSQGIVAVNREIHHDDVYAISKRGAVAFRGREEKRSAGLRRIQRVAVVDAGVAEFRCRRHP